MRRLKGDALPYCPAKDKPSADGFRERPDLPAQKLSLLQRHDRESGDLYGVVTLVKGMPVALTEDIDRSPDKQLLRGKVGEIHSWIVDEKETSTYEDGVHILTKLPKLVMVKFRTAQGEEVELRNLVRTRTVYIRLRRRAELGFWTRADSTQCSKSRGSSCHWHPRLQ